MRKPRDVPSRDDFYMGMAFWAASKSKDPSTQVGAFLVSCENKPLGWGYNGPPKRINDAAIDWERPHKYKFIKHAESNAIRHSSGPTEGAILYVTARPCKSCMLDIVDAEIAKVLYFPFAKKSDGSSMLQDNDEITATEEIARVGRVQLVEYKGNLNWMRDRIKFMEGLGIFG